MIAPCAIRRGNGVFVGVTVGVDVAVGVGVNVGVAVLVGVGDGNGVAVCVGVAVGRGVVVGNGVAVGNGIVVLVGEGANVADATGAAAINVADGAVATTLGDCPRMISAIKSPKKINPKRTTPTTMNIRDRERGRVLGRTAGTAGGITVTGIPTFAWGKPRTVDSVSAAKSVSAVCPTCNVSPSRSHCGAVKRTPLRNVPLVLPVSEITRPFAC